MALVELRKNIAGEEDEELGKSIRLQLGRGETQQEGPSLDLENPNPNPNPNLNPNPKPNPNPNTNPNTNTNPNANPNLGYSDVSNLTQEEGSSSPDKRGGGGVKPSEEKVLRVDGNRKRKGGEEKASFGHWKEDWVVHLCHIRGSMQTEFSSPPKRGVDLWYNVYLKLLARCPDFDRDSEACRKKWRNVFKKYKTATTLDPSTGARTQACKHYPIVDLYLCNRTSFGRYSRKAVPPLPVLPLPQNCIPSTQICYSQEKRVTITTTASKPLPCSTNSICFAVNPTPFPVSLRCETTPSDITPVFGTSWRHPSPPAPAPVPAPSNLPLPTRETTRQYKEHPFVASLINNRLYDRTRGVSAPAPAPPAANSNPGPDPDPDLDPALAIMSRMVVATQSLAVNIAAGIEKMSAIESQKLQVLHEISESLKGVTRVLGNKSQSHT